MNTLTLYAAGRQAEMQSESVNIIVFSIEMLVYEGEAPSRTGVPIGCSMPCRSPRNSAVSSSSSSKGSRTHRQLASQPTAGLMPREQKCPRAAMAVVDDELWPRAVAMHRVRAPGLARLSRMIQRQHGRHEHAGELESDRMQSTEAAAKHDNHSPSVALM